MPDLMADLASEAADLTSLPTEEGSARLRRLGVELVETDKEIAELDARIKERRTRRNEIAMREMPDLMSEVGQDRIGLPDVGEFGVDLVAEPYYHANIASDWDEERRQTAFQLLERKGDGDLIKNILTMQFSRGDHDKVQALLRVLDSPEFTTMLLSELQGAGARTNNLELPPPSVEMTVPWNTLTAYVKSEIASGTLHEPWMSEADPVVDPLEVLGATVGTVVKIKPRKGK